MIDYTPHHQYTEVLDKPKKERSFTQKWTKRAITIEVVASIICVLLLGFQYLPCWIMILISIIMVFIMVFVGKIALIGYAMASLFPPLSKSEAASVIKGVIGFDFGDDFKLLKTSSHDYEEYLYIFSESSFEPLKNHLESIPDKDGQDDGRSIGHQINGKAGFYLADSRLEYGCCGNIEAIWVDYQERTLKHTFTIY